MTDDLVKRLRELNTFEWHARPATTKEVCFEAADRIEKLETALREVFSLGDWGANILARTIILEALETTDCSLGNKDENP